MRTLVRIIATHITMKEGGDWIKIKTSALHEPRTKQWLSGINVHDRRFLSYAVESATTMRAQAAAVMFSAGSIWDNSILQWR